MSPRKSKKREACLFIPLFSPLFNAQWFFAQMFIAQWSLVLLLHVYSTIFHYTTLLFEYNEFFFFQIQFCGSACDGTYFFHIQ